MWRSRDRTRGITRRLHQPIGPLLSRAGQSILSVRMIDLFEEFATIIQAFTANKLEYALCGGMALAVYGIPRATVDMDFLILPESAEEARKIAVDLGYKTEAGPMSLAQGKVQIRRFVKFDPDGEDFLSLDFLLVTPELLPVWEGRTRIAWESGSLGVISKAGLIEMKSLRNSGQDRDDIDGLKE